MEDLQKYLRVLNQGRVTLSDLPYGTKRAARTVLFVLPELGTSEGLYKMMIPAMALNRNSIHTRAIVVGLQAVDYSRSVNHHDIKLLDGLLREATHVVLPFVSYDIRGLVSDIRGVNKKIRVSYNVDFDFYHVPDTWLWTKEYNTKDAQVVIEKNIGCVDQVIVSNRKLSALLESKKKDLRWSARIVFLPAFYHEQYFMDLEDQQDRDRPERFRIGVIVPPGHLQDMTYIKGPLVDLQKKHKNMVEVIVVGHDGMHKDKNMLRGLDFEYVPLVPWNYYYQQLMNLSLHAALLPAPHNKFNENSRNIYKFIEFTCLGILPIVSDIAPYKDIASHNDNAVICHAKEDWLQEIGILLQDFGKLEMITNNGLATITSRRVDLPENTKILDYIYGI